MGKKRKRDIVEQLNGTKEPLKIKIPASLPCIICFKPIYNFRELKDVTTCSYDCQAVLILSMQNRLLHEPEYKSFEEMKE